LIAVLALDGLDPDIVGRLRAAGRLPVLGALADRGLSGRLRSSFPPASVPAWSTFLSGVGPGRHGLFDFTRLVGSRLAFQNGADRGVPTLLELADAAGRRVASLGVPTTYPAPPLAHGAVLSGFDSPVSGEPDARGAHPVAFWRGLRAEGLDLTPSALNEGRKGPGWHSRAAREIGASIERRVAQALRVLRAGPWDLVVFHFQAADTAGHHFMRWFDPSSPRFASDPERARVIPDVYDALDRACRRIFDACPSESLRVVLSDHGMGPASCWIAHVNRFLEERGLLRQRPLSAPAVAGALRDAALRFLPRRAQAVLFRALRDRVAAPLEGTIRLAAIDRERSVAFSEESSTLPAVWILDAAARERVLRALRGWEAVRRVFRREDLYRGPLARRAPDLLLELHHGLARTPPGYRGPALRRLADVELDGERGAGTNGVHRPEGLIVAEGKGVVGPAPVHGAWIGDLAPTILAALGVPIPAWMEGRVLSGFACQPRWTEEPPPDAPRDVGGAVYDAPDAALLERRLQSLGYLG
jgi:predicted AlkP superfamily phosphohydrolase/phosphomutase